MFNQIRLISYAVFLMLTSALTANNLSVTNISLTGYNSAADYTMVQFDLSWENSWRISTGPANWDAAWVFVKYSTDGATWNHAYLNNSGHTSPSCTVQVGLVDETAAFDNTTNPAVGAFVYRDAEGTGTFSPTGIQLRWNYGANRVADDAVVDIQVFAVEMVYVPQSPFSLGSGGAETSAFYKYPNPTTPYLVSSEAAINVGATNDYLYYNSSTHGGDRSGPIPAAYPKGYAGFYMQKYELSQQAYVDFLNTLPTSAANTRFANTNTNRNGIVLSATTGIYETTLPFVACNFLNWDDGTAWADWAGLRPFTELEYEKACRGDQTPMANEYAWGTASIAAASYTLNNNGAANEGIATNYNTTGTAGNASYSVTDGIIDGPLRGGIFAAHASNSGRVTAGASFYGVYELTGNLWERTISIGNVMGRLFTGIHGDGRLNNASHNVINWPSGNSAIGSNFRGGCYLNSLLEARVSDRTYASNTSYPRNYHLGFRVVRGLPASPGE